MTFILKNKTLMSRRKIFISSILLLIYVMFSLFLLNTSLFLAKEHSLIIKLTNSVFVKHPIEKNLDNSLILSQLTNNHDISIKKRKYHFLLRTRMQRKPFTTSKKKYKIHHIYIKNVKRKFNVRNQRFDIEDIFKIHKRFKKKPITLPKLQESTGKKPLLLLESLLKSRSGKDQTRKKIQIMKHQKKDESTKTKTERYSLKFPSIKSQRNSNDAMTLENVTLSSLRKNLPSIEQELKIIQKENDRMSSRNKKTEQKASNNVTQLEKNIKKIGNSVSYAKRISGIDENISDEKSTGDENKKHKETKPGKEIDKHVFLCPVYKLHQKQQIPEFNLSCKPHISLPSGCKYAAREYVYNQSANTCSRQLTIQNICNVTRDTNGDGRIVRCSFKPCGENFKGDVLIHSFEPKQGEPVVVHYEGNSVKTLEKKVQNAVEESLKNGYHFLFLSCGETVYKTQLLPLLPEIQGKSTTDPKLKEQPQIENPPKININLLNFDSISRAHFYRSLKKSIEAMNRINDETEAEVLDFELFQSIHGYSQENSYALMTGRTFPPNISSSSSREETPSRITDFYRLLKTKGYSTFYQDDMCFDSGYGLKRDIGALEVFEFQKFKAILDNGSYIDDYGLTFASCKMIRDVFNGEEMTFNMNSDQNVCYNGRPNDAYFLEYNMNKFQTLEAKGQNLFSYNNLQFAHDAYGLNIQTMDDSVADFIDKSSQLRQTLTIISADHGNSYTGYTSYEMEGRYEQYHPSLFIIIPKGVRDILGDDKIRDMRLNKERLLTMVDVHDGFHHIVDPSHSKRGFLHPIPENRTCKTVQLGKPNLCVCEGSESPMTNKTEFIGHIEFATGYLNNMINNASKGGRCKTIVPQAIVNILQRSEGDGVVVSFDLLAEPGKNSINKEERFSFDMFYRNSESSKNSFDMKMRNLARLSKYGIYNKQCSDAPDTFRYCVCDTEKADLAYVGKKKERQIRTSEGQNKTFSDLLGQRSSPFYEIRQFSDYNMTVRESYLQSEYNTIALYVRDYIEKEVKQLNLNESKTIIYTHVVTFEVIHTGDNDSSSYQAEVNLTDLENMKLLSTKSCQGVVKPKRISYLCSIQRADHQPAFYRYSFAVKKL